MATKPHHHQSILVHDVIINVLNVQGEKANLQGGKRVHHPSEWCPIMSQCNVLHPMSNKLQGALPRMWAYFPPVNQYDHICKMRAHLSIVQAPGSRRCERICLNVPSHHVTQRSTSHVPCLV
jgi:hypothetical protein